MSDYLYSLEIVFSNLNNLLLVLCLKHYIPDILNCLHLFIRTEINSLQQHFSCLHAFNLQLFQKHFSTASPQPCR